MKKVFNLIVMLLIVFFVGFLLSQGILDNIFSSPKVDCNLAITEPKFVHDSYYTGPLIDTHVHMPVSGIVSMVAIKFGIEEITPYDDELSIDNIACQFESEGIIKAFGFNVIPKYAISKSINKVKSNEKRHPGKFVHFYQPTPNSALNPGPKKVDQILTDNSNIFMGYGEVKYNAKVDNEFGLFDQEYIEIFDIINKHNIMTMMHPGPEHKEEVIELLKNHPNINFLFHGGESSSWIIEVLETYNNAYKTIQPNDHLFGWSDKNGDLLRPTKDEYLEYMRNNFNSLLDAELNFKKKIIEEHPETFMWGTDRLKKWHFDPEVGAMVEEFGRAFIAQLDPSVQEKFAYKNAENILNNQRKKSTLIKISDTNVLEESQILDSKKTSNSLSTKLGCCYTCSEFAIENVLYSKESCLSNPKDWKPFWTIDPVYCPTILENGEDIPDISKINGIATCGEIFP